MKNLYTNAPLIALTKLIALILLLVSINTLADQQQRLVDDFNHPENNSLGLPRIAVDDKSVGGNTSVDSQFKQGVFYFKGKISPARGQPGWASKVLLLDPQNKAFDASQFSGIGLRVKVIAGNLSVSANSTEITNYDYHAVPVTVKMDGQFHSVILPFKSMKRAWSKQTTLNTASLASLSIVAFDVQPASFEFEIDQIYFY